tara:strand:- start:279 stop:1271 length:993 start_codon:yes stop_codon:yes gene_type:complete
MVGTKILIAHGYEGIIHWDYDPIDYGDAESLLIFSPKKSVERFENNQQTLETVRKYIRCILLEDYKSFVKGILARPNLTKIKPSSDDIPDETEYIKQADAWRKEWGKAIKDQFRIEADHQWLSMLETVHWTWSTGSLQDILNKRKDEISCTMTKHTDPYVKTYRGQPIGLWVDGRITLAANSENDIFTGKEGYYRSPQMRWGEDVKVKPKSKIRWTDEKKAKAKQRQASSGINKYPLVADYLTDTNALQRWFRRFPYVIDAKTWKPQRGIPNEALVDNWKPKGIILLDQKLIQRIRDPNNREARNIRRIAEKYNLSLYEVSKELIWSPNE